MKLSLIIQGVDRLTAPGRKAASTLARLTGGLKSTGVEGRKTSRILDAVASAARIGAIGLGTMTMSAARLAGRAGLGVLRKSAELTKSALGRTFSFGSRLVAGTFLAGTAAAGLFSRSMIGLGSRFEQFQVVLENTEGSAARARRAMAWVKNFAKTTPYEVEQVMEAFVQLKAYGIDPMGGALTSLGNASSGMSKDLMAAVEMLADAQTGEFERLKEFGVRARVQGKQVSFTYMNAGKEIRRTARNSAADIQKALMGIFDQRFNGMMKRQSSTMKGFWSNLMDMLANWQLQIADAGIFDFLKGKLQQLLNKVNELAANGTLKRWAEQISKWMVEAGTKLAKFIEQTDWKKVGTEIKEVAVGFWSIAKAVAWIARFAVGVGKFIYNVAMWTPTRSSEAERGAQPGAGPRRLALRSAPRLGPPIRRGGNAVAVGGRGATRVGGTVDINIRTAPGTHATVSRSASTNRDVPLRINRGRSMAAEG